MIIAITFLDQSLQLYHWNNDTKLSEKISDNEHLEDLEQMNLVITHIQEKLKSQTNQCICISQTNLENKEERDYFSDILWNTLLNYQISVHQIVRSSSKPLLRIL